MNKNEILTQITALEYIVMSYFMNGKKYKEISKIMNISVNIVKIQIYSVVKKLKADNPIHSAAILANLLYK